MHWHLLPCQIASFTSRSGTLSQPLLADIFTTITSLPVLAHTWPASARCHATRLETISSQCHCLADAVLRHDGQESHILRCLTSLRSQRSLDLSRCRDCTFKPIFCLSTLAVFVVPPSSPFVDVSLLHLFFQPRLTTYFFSHPCGSFPRMARLFSLWVLALHRGFDAPTGLSPFLSTFFLAFLFSLYLVRPPGI